MPADDGRVPGALCGAVPVTAPQYAVKVVPVQRTLANLPSRKELRGRADESVVVRRLDNRYPQSFQRRVNGRREQGEHILHNCNVGLLCSDETYEFLLGPPGVVRAGDQRRLAWPRHRVDFPVVAGVGHHRMATFAEAAHEIFEDERFTSSIRVMVVTNED